MNNFLRARVKSFTMNPTNELRRPLSSVVFGLLLVAVGFVPQTSFGLTGFLGGTIVPGPGSPQLVCSGGVGTFSLSVSTCSTAPIDWHAHYVVDSSFDGGATWHTPVFGVTSGTVSATSGPLVYTTPVLTATTCYSIYYRFRLDTLAGHCSGNTTFTSLNTQINVCPQPDSVTGPSEVCVGGTVAMAATPAGGTWNISPISIATINTSGVVTGVSPGTATVSYSLSGGCFATRTVVVDTTPSAIVGPDNVCAGSVTNYTLAVLPFIGTWSSSNAAAGSIDPVTGDFTSASPLASAEVTTITITHASGCFRSTPVTVNPMPAAIGCNTAFCYGGSVTLCDATSGGTWSSGSPGIATVDVGTGTVTGGAPTGGTATITYSVLPLGATCTVSAVVTVNPLPAAIGGPASGCVGTTVTLTDATAGGTWTSSNPAVGTINSSSGVFGGVSAGTTGITYTVTASGCTATRIMTVSTGPDSIVGGVHLCDGAANAITLTGYPAGGTWTSFNASIASVGSTTGVVTGHGSGVVNISYILPGGCYMTHVVIAHIMPDSITATDSVICEGTNITYVGHASAPGVWQTSDAAVAAINVSTGLITGFGAGTATITYTVLGGPSPGCYVTKDITVNATPGAITGPDVICVGSSASYSTGATGGVWSVSDPLKATVSPGSGVVTGVATGTVTITYNPGGGCGFVTKDVTVSAVPAAITGTFVLCAGSATTLTSATPGGTWSISNPYVDSIGASSGIITANHAGTDIVQYTLGSGCATTAVVTVNPSPGPITGPPGVCLGSCVTLMAAVPGGVWSSTVPPVATVNPATGQVCGISTGLTVINYSVASTGCAASISYTVYPPVLPTDGTLNVCVGSTTTLSNVTPGGPGTWTSSNVGVASVNLYTGVVTGNSPGTATITYTMPTGCITTSMVTVNPLPATITGYPHTCIGFCTTFGSTTPGGTWSSDDPSVATATTLTSTTGQICGITSGTALISYTLPTGCARNIVAHVDTIPGPPTGTLSICVGGTSTLTPPAPGGTWISSDTIVAKVYLGTGLVTGYTAGTADITYTLPSGCSSVATITVNPVPPANTGIQYMCVGNTTTLSNLYPGGSWSSSNTGVATVTGGVTTTTTVTGVGAGTATITYSLPSGCHTTSVVTVYPLPAISGSVLVCPGVASALTGSPAGGLWVSTPTVIATVGSTTGIVTGHATGTAIVTYTLATSCRTTAIITVQPLPAPISGPSQVCEGSSIVLTDATVGGGTWSSSNPSVATIDTTGMVTGVTPGTVTITYTANSTGCVITTVITVNPLPGDIYGPPMLCAGDSVTLGSTSPGGSWSSGGTYATVGSSSGVVTGVAAGVEDITYTLPTGCYKTYSVTVNPSPSVSGATLSVCHGYTILLNASDTGGTWSISPTTIATIDASGLVTGVAPGTATATYTLPTGCFGTAVVTVNPLPAPITGMLNLCVNDTTTLHDTVSGGTWSSENIYIAVIDPSTGLLATVSAGTVTVSYTLPTGCYTTAIVTINPTPQPITGTLTACVGLTSTLYNITTGGSWSSSNPAIATIGSASGDVTAISPGTAIMTYTLPSSCPRTVVFTVNPNPTPITGALNICDGDTTILSSTPGGGTWSSSDPSVAFIFLPTGQMIGMSPGTATIIYKLPTTCLTSSVVTVNPVPTPASILGNRVVCQGESSTLSNTMFPGGTWASSNTAVATIGSTSGVFTGVSGPGTANITYTSPFGCDTFITVTVNPLPSTIGGVLSVCVGNTTTLTNASAGGTWISGNPGVATIGSTSGIVSGVTDGTAIITYKFTGTGCQVTAIVTVNPLPNPIVGSDHLCVGSNTILSSTSTGGAWSSGNPAVATVTAISTGFDSAMVAGVSAGPVNITYTLPTGCYTVFAMTINPLPAPISGPDTVCVGSTITLVDTPFFSTGTWSIDSVTIATIDSATGVLTGVTEGIVTVTYTTDHGCEAYYIVTVHPLPTAIYGGDEMCVGSMITVIDTTAGGTWSISDTSLAVITTVVDSSCVITGVSAGSVTVTYMLPTGCYDTWSVTVHPLPDVTVMRAASGVICKYATDTLTASGAGVGGTYSWSPATGLSATTGVIVTASPTITTTYTVTGTTVFGCSDTAIITVVIDSMLNDITIVGDSDLCKGECTVLMAHGREGTFFNWRPATGLSCTICDTTTACPLETITYNALAIDSLGCRDSLDFTVTVHPLPVMLYTPNPAIVCNGSTTQLHVRDSITSNGTRFAWFPNAFISCDTCSDPILSNTTNLIYRVTGITSFGCFDSIKIPVTVLDSAFNSINKDTVICKGTSAQLNAVSFNPDGSRSDFYWLNNYAISNQWIPNPVVNPEVTTTYTVAITPNVCWPDTLYTTVVVVDKPQISIDPSSISVASGTQVPLTATIVNETIISSYAWSPANTLSCDSCYHTIATPTGTTTYTFAVTSVYGCTSIGTVTVTLGCDNSQIFIPNTFTPNGDGMNDRFYVSGKGIEKITKFQVFNRWGEMVYERYNIPANDPSYGWDGQYKGVVLPPDVFYYVVDAICNLGDEFHYKGDITIVR